MKELLKRLEEAEKRADIADSEWEADPENETKEEAFDKAYKEEYEAFNKLAKEIEKITNGQINRATAGSLIRSRRNELKDIISRIA